MPKVRVLALLFLFATLTFSLPAFGRNATATAGDPKPQGRSAACQTMIEQAGTSSAAGEGQQGLAQLRDLVQRRLGEGVALSGDRIGLRVELRQGARRVRLSAGPAGGALAVHWRF